MKTLCTIIIVALAVAGMVCSVPGTLSAQTLNKMGGQQSGPETYAVPPPAPLTLANLQFGPLTGSPEDMARAYLRHEYSRFQMKSDLSDLAVQTVQESPAGYHVRFTQSYQNLPVYQADIVVSIDRKNYVEFLASNYKSGLSLPATVAALSTDASLRIARTHLGVRGELHGPESSRLMVKVEQGQARLAFRVIIPAFEPRGDWEVFVDAQSGEVISVTDMTCFHGPKGVDGPGLSPMKVDGSGYLFDPDPLSTAHATYGDPGFSDNNDADAPQLTAERKLRTLRDLASGGGMFQLSGPYVTAFDWDAPNTPVATVAHPDSFRFTRFQDGFEDVLVYFHLDQSQRYIQSLGFSNVQNNSIQADPHGFNGADNSAYYPSTNRLTFGEGGVDDAEDADVVLHEYGHAIHHGTVPGWSGSGQQGALGEGFGDYWAESYSRSLGHWQPSDPAYYWVFDWDGHNPFWAGRVLNYTAHYPEGLTGTIHTDGQMWSSSLMSIWNEIGREVLDKLVLQSHFYLPASGVTMALNAEAVIQADRNLYGGTHLQSIVYWFGQRGFINPANYVPQITHTPLTDSENLSGPYTVTAVIAQGASPLIPSSLKVHWTRTGAFTDSLTLIPTGTPNQYGAQIPGNGFEATYRYYIVALDSGGGSASHPSGAPGNFHSFHVGLDTIPPAIVHNPLRDQALIRWPARIRASVTDNIAIDSVWVDFVRIRGPLPGSFPLQVVSGSTYEGTFPLDTTQLMIGDSIYYKVIARDGSSGGNIAVSPPVGFHKFAIIAARGVVLVVDDDAATEMVNVSDKGADDRTFAEKGASSRLIARTLDQLGFVVDTASFATHDTSLYQGFDVVVLSAGSKTSGIFGDAAKRAALVNFSRTGGKIWVEGGEVGYLFRKSGTTTDLDPPFRRMVLHDSAWISDVSSSNMVITSPSHPMFTTPNTITGPVPFPSSGIGHRDAMRLIPGDIGAKKIAGWSTYATQGPDTAAIIVYNPLPDPNVGQIVFSMFSVAAITDTAVARNLIENTAEFLMARPGGAYIVAQPASLNFGAVQLGDSLTLPLSIKNVGTGSLQVTNITNVSPRLTVVPTSFTLGAQETVLVSVKFKPLVTGNVIDTLRFISNASSPPVIPVTARGGLPVVSVRPDSFYFSLPSTSDTTTAQLVIRNTGEDTFSFTLEELLVSSTPQMIRSTEQQESYVLPKDAVDHRAGTPTILGGGGPDAFGYIWIDSDEPGGPQFAWTDITSVGTQITSWSGTSDDGYAIVPLPFAFRFYGNEYSSIKVVTNGFLSFDVASSNNAYTNGAIPATAEPNNGLFAWWDDLNLTSSGTVHYYSDVANSRFIVQYTSVPHYGTTEPGVYTFQVILKSGGDVVYQYLDMQQTLNSATIGIENGAGSIGLQTVFNAAYMHNNLAIRFTRDAVSWMSTNMTSGTVAPHDSQAVNLYMHPGPLPVGNYLGRLKLTGNIPGAMYIPVHLYATGPVGVGETGGIPTEFALSQNYPNPFNPVTSIKFALPQASQVSLVVYNLLGQQVALLVNEAREAGYHQVSLDGHTLSSGVYFYRLEAGSFVATRKLMLLK